MFMCMCLLHCIVLLDTSSNIQDLNPVRIAFAILVHDHATVAVRVTVDVGGDI